MCDSDRCSCEDFPPPPYAGPPLDAAGAEAILGSYPELWRHWQEEMLGPNPIAGRGTGGVRMWHSPEYLNEVVSEYLWLQTGGEEVSPDLEARCEAVARTYPGFAERRRQQLADPWWRALPGVGYEWKDQSGIRYYYDPQWMAADIRLWHQSKDPYSAVSLKEEATSWATARKPEDMGPWN